MNNLSSNEDRRPFQRDNSADGTAMSIRYDETSRVSALNAIVVTLKSIR